MYLYSTLPIDLHSSMYLFEVESLNINNVYNNSKNAEPLYFYKLISCIGKKHAKFIKFENFSSKLKEFINGKIGKVVISLSCGITGDYKDVVKKQLNFKSRRSFLSYYSYYEDNIIDKDIEYSFYGSMGDKYKDRLTLDVFDIRPHSKCLCIPDEYIDKKAFYSLPDKCAYLLPFLEFNPYILEDMLEAAKITVTRENMLDTEIKGIELPISFYDSDKSNEDALPCSIFLSDFVKLSNINSTIEDYKSFLIDPTITIINTNYCGDPLKQYITTKKMKSFINQTEKTIKEYMEELYQNKEGYTIW